MIFSPKNVPGLLASLFDIDASLLANLIFHLFPPYFPTLKERFVVSQKFVAECCASMFFSSGQVRKQKYDYEAFVVYITS